MILNLHTPLASVTCAAQSQRAGITLSDAEADLTSLSVCMTANPQAHIRAALSADDEAPLAPQSFVQNLEKLGDFQSDVPQDPHEFLLSLLAAIDCSQQGEGGARTVEEREDDGRPLKPGTSHSCPPPATGGACWSWNSCGGTGGSSDAETDTSRDSPGGLSGCDIRAHSEQTATSGATPGASPLPVVDDGTMSQRRRTAAVGGGLVDALFATQEEVTVTCGGCGVATARTETLRGVSLDVTLFFGKVGGGAGGGGAGGGGAGGGASEGDEGTAGQSGQKLTKSLACPGAVDSGAVDSDQSLGAKALGCSAAAGLTGVTHQCGQVGVMMHSLQAALEYYCKAQDIEGGAAVYACGRCGGRTPATRQVGVCVCVCVCMCVCVCVCVYEYVYTYIGGAGEVPAGAASHDGSAQALRQPRGKDQSPRVLSRRILPRAPPDCHRQPRFAGPL